MNNASATSRQVRPITNNDRDWLFDLHEQAHRERVERAYGSWEEEEQQRGFFAPVVNDHDVFILSDGDQKVGAVYLGERDGDVWPTYFARVPRTEPRAE